MPKSSKTDCKAEIGASCKSIRRTVTVLLEHCKLLDSSSSDSKKRTVRYANRLVSG